MSASPPPLPLEDNLREYALGLGFDAVGIADPDAVAGAGLRLDRYLELGRHGEMGWMADKADRRRHPKALWPDVRSVMMLGLNYGPAQNPLQQLDWRQKGTLSVYARNKDYHDLIKGRLRQLARWVVDKHKAQVKLFVDTAPVMEKPLAEAAGLGWQGKHTNLVSPDYGSWLFLGALFTSLDLSPDHSPGDHCGSCRRCLDICPTKAFPAPYQLDARRCISYLTIEYKGHIAREFRKAMGNRIYGCDDCLAVCPWNKFAQKTKDVAFFPRTELAAPDLADLADLDDADFRAVFAGSPIKRTGRDRFVRNVMIALGNSADPTLLPVIEARLHDESPLVRAMAVWAVHQLATPDRLASLRAQHLPTETDPAVIAEWAGEADKAGQNQILAKALETRS
ncbi:epoxyqueuosine reductase [Iodidimonas muriae]|uniref:Epoxyqueuosine reductase n=1 Tax=Iodidimonas muriae TaxID=261467 RepID=A0ABQ2L926_9PROT|nr:tRNA epoxyqueuosine(34) reductase QueG [Iodidimonas muriae]GGO07223.1 epoxyqueuosine reductase [Iodidimonas muriae]